MPTTAKPKAPAPPAKKIRLQYLERELPADEPLEINEFPGRPEVQVLDVHPFEGAGLGNWMNRWKLVLVWR